MSETEFSIKSYTENLRPEEQELLRTIRAIEDLADRAEVLQAAFEAGAFTQDPEKLKEFLTNN